MRRRWEPMQTTGGVVLQSGLGMRTRAERFSPEAPVRGPYRALVVNTFVSDEDSNSSYHQVECDVVLVHSNVLVRSVPVVQKGYGVANTGSLWIPKAATRTVSGEPLNVSAVFSPTGKYMGPPSGLDDSDGDMVLLDFIEANRNYPIIVGALPHERSHRTVIDGTGWTEAGNGGERGTAQKHEAYRRHAGTEERINADGDYLLDTVGATADTEDESPGAGGQVRIRVKAGQRFTVEMDGTDVLEVWKDSGGVHIDLGEGATERIVLGDSFMSYFNGHEHFGPAGLSGPPVIPMTAVLLSSQHKVK